MQQGVGMTEINTMVEQLAKAYMVALAIEQTRRATQ